MVLARIMPGVSAPGETRKTDYNWTQYAPLFKPGRLHVNTLKQSFVRHRADAGMTFITVIWGFHFIVMKRGLSDFSPMTYNALRFLVALPLISLVPLRDRAIVQVTWRDVVVLALLSVVGPIGYQIFFATGLKLTTSTNTALLVATMPAWTAVFSIAAGLVLVRRRMLTGIILTLGGVTLVILSQSGAGLSLSHDDLVGSFLALVAAVTSAVSNLFTKPVIDRLGGMRLAIWTYWFTTLGMTLIALPDLLTLTRADFPLRVWPNILYSGLLSSALGFLVWNIALRDLGPTRAATYHNFTPILATFGGIVVLNDPLTLGLLAGGFLTLLGVLIVRHNTFMRPTRATITAPANSK